MEAFLAIAGDQRVIAGLAIFVGFHLLLFLYILYQERKSRKKDPNWLGDWLI